MNEQKTGRCDKCGEQFKYYLIHNGFNESAHAYCDKCGMACVLHDASPKIPKKCNFFDRHNPYRIIDDDIEKFLIQCSCGGSFKKSALPRCPHCGIELSQFKGMIFRTVILDDRRRDDCWIEIKNREE